MASGMRHSQFADVVLKPFFSRLFFATDANSPVPDRVIDLDSGTVGQVVRSKDSGPKFTCFDSKFP